MSLEISRVRNKLQKKEIHFCDHFNASRSYRGVQRIRTMKIVKKPSGLPRLVRITPTIRITQIVPKTDSYIRNSKLFFYKRPNRASASSLILILFVKFDLGGIEL